MNINTLVAIGIDYHEQEWCSRLALTEASVERLLDRLDAEPTLSEAAVLATCNRVELYAVLAVRETGKEVLVRDLLKTAGVFPADRPPLTARAGAEVLRHLARVACGLESLVIGETEILGQVAVALEGPVARATAGPAIGELFRAAIHAGKRARTETEISRHALNVGSLAVRHATSLIGDLGRRRIAMVGTGAGAQQVLSSLPARARNGLTIVSRERSRAEAVALRWGGVAALRGDLQEVLKTVEVVFTATDGADLVTVQTVQNRADGRELLVVDISAPPNVSDGVHELPDVKVVRMTDLDAAMDQALARRKGERRAVERIVEEEVRGFERWAFEQRATPIVRALYQRAEQTRNRLAQSTYEQIGVLDEGSRERIDKLTRTLTNSLLHEPVTRIRSAAADGAWEEYERIARDLFGLCRDNG